MIENYVRKVTMQILWGYRINHLYNIMQACYSNAENHTYI